MGVCKAEMRGMRVVDWFFFFSSRRRHTRFKCDWSSDVCSSDLEHCSRLPGSWTEAGKAASPAGASNARELALFRVAGITRSEERRVGKEGRSRWSPYH